MLKGCKLETNKLYDTARKNESKITAEMNEIASGLNVEMVCLKGVFQKEADFVDILKKQQLRAQ